MAQASRVTHSVSVLPRLLYIGDVPVADTMGGAALLYRLLQFYPADKLSIVCAVEPGMSKLPGVAYHHYGAGFPRLLHSRIAEEYMLWHAWRYYRVPRAIARVADAFKPGAILSISHVSAWLAAWQLAGRLEVPLHLIAHDDFVYASRFPHWSRAWAERRFSDCYRAAAARFCISDTMEAIYRRRFGAPGGVIYPTHKTTTVDPGVSPRVDRAPGPLTFGFGGSINSLGDMEQILAFARIASDRGHVLAAFTPQHAELAARAAAANVTIEAYAPIHSDALRRRFREDVDCLLLPQSMAVADLPLVSTAFPSKWADYATVGLPVIVWAPTGSSSARFVEEHPGCAMLVTSTTAADVAAAIDTLRDDVALRQSLAAALLIAGRTAFSPEAAWQTFRSAVEQHHVPA